MNIRAANKRYLYIIILIALSIAGCHSNANKPIDLLQHAEYWLAWEGSQSNYATPANIWRGFIAREGNLVANDTKPTIAFSLKETGAREFVHIVYRSNSEKIQVFVNEQFAAILPVSSKSARYSFSCDKLRTGFNRIRFAWAGKNFHLRALYLQKKGARFTHEDRRVLKATDGFKTYLLPGRIDFEFRGQASLEARSFAIIEDRELSTPITRTISVAGEKTVFSYSSATPFVISIRCLQGDASVPHLWYQADVKDKKMPELGKISPAIEKTKIKDIFIFLFDGCQAEHLALYGYNRDTAPRLSEFAKDGLVFRRAFSNGSYTPAAVGSIFTGLYPDHHQIVTMFDILDSKITTLPQFLKTRGYKTAVFTANAHVSNRSGLVRDVDHYRLFLDDFRFGQSHKMVREFADWVQDRPAPLFSYMHFMEPHFPIVPPPPFLNQYKKIMRLKKDLPIRNLDLNDRNYSSEEIQDVIDDYDSSINYVDSLFGMAIDHLKKIKRYDDSLIILLADHGEGCYEHGVWGHGADVFPEITRVPLVVKFPTACKQTGEVQALIETGSLFPTLYHILTGQEGPFDIASSLASLERPQKKAAGMVFTQGFSEEQVYAVAWNHWYYMNAFKRNWQDLYNLSEKPFQSLLSSQPDLANYLQLRLLAWMRRVQSIANEAAKADRGTLSQKELDHFKSLGYL